MSEKTPLLLWFRQDLRLGDNPALRAAAATGQPIVPIFIHDEVSAGAWSAGGASRWWLDKSLRALAASLGALGTSLVLRTGPAIKVLKGLVSETKARAVYWNRCYEPFAVARDKALMASLKSDGLEVKTFNGALLFEPWEVETGSGTPYKVFTSFWKAARQGATPHQPAPAPTTLKSVKKPPASEDLDDWGLHPSNPDWSAGFNPVWTPGEAGALARLDDFLDEAVNTYSEDRDRPDLEGTSRLSPHLHYGEISPRTVWHATMSRADAGKISAQGADKFLAEIGWREFSNHLLFHFPQITTDNLQSKFDAFPWSSSQERLHAWQRGRTGYPIVDAGMRQLWTTGWMHNRVRMIVGSFLVKHLLIDWREGERWFWDTLVDADMANNSASWQWVAGCGADAAPYFRIFNPMLQAAKFDPGGEYIRRWVPELKDLPTKHLYEPWAAPDTLLKSAGVVLGETYPKPIVDHKEARKRALDAFDKVKQAA